MSAPSPEAPLHSATASENAPVDAVITWVDGADPAHRAKLAAYLHQSGGPPPAAADPTRFSDCGEIEWCVVSLLRFAPWLRTIHIVTDAQAPALVGCLAGTRFEGRVRVVDHREFFTGYEAFLPTFSNRSIECLLWRIPGLAERFIYFNDDFQLLQPVAVSDFFDAGGLVLRGRWRQAPSRRWRALRARLAAGWRRLRPAAGVARPGNHAAQALSARLAGLDDRYLQVPHVPHPLRRSVLATHFRAHPQLLLENLRHRLRASEQFLTTALGCHLELAAGTARIDNAKGALRLKTDVHSLARLHSEMRRADDDPSIAFCCVQSLDRADPAIRVAVLTWLEKRIGTLDALVSEATGAAESAPEPGGR